MFSTAETIEAAVAEWLRLKSAAPFRFSGKWFACRCGNEWRAFRTLAAVKRNATSGDYVVFKL